MFFFSQNLKKVCVAFSITIKKGDRFVTGISLNCGMKQINSPIQHILTFGADHKASVDSFLQCPDTRELQEDGVDITVLP